MKLTCVVIVAVLFLTACQLITADDSRSTQRHRALRSTTKLSMSTRCKPPGSKCSPSMRDCCTTCISYTKRCRKYYN
uniref:Omega-conotoxin MoVIA n=2 Tax=Conus TaxID=6490 RepID=O16A_CONMB|nr:RecName: Full=Omega-conotoxin MoVIA; Contains: RecName: Full=Omega-conotoxin MoVIB; Flags: Precursor [Conus moncuri]